MNRPLSTQNEARDALRQQRAQMVHDQINSSVLPRLSTTHMIPSKTKGRAPMRSRTAHTHAARSCEESNGLTRIVQTAWRLAVSCCPARLQAWGRLWSNFESLHHRVTKLMGDMWEPPFWQLRSHGGTRYICPIHGRRLDPPAVSAHEKQLGCTQQRLKTD